MKLRSFVLLKRSLPSAKSYSGTTGSDSDPWPESCSFALWFLPQHRASVRSMPRGRHIGAHPATDAPACVKAQKDTLSR